MASSKNSTPRLLKRLGFRLVGQDPDARDFNLWQDQTCQFAISIPVAGIGPVGVAWLIFHAGADAARRDIAQKFAALEKALKPS